MRCTNILYVIQYIREIHRYANVRCTNILYVIQYIREIHRYANGDVLISYTLYSILGKYTGMQT